MSSSEAPISLGDIEKLNGSVHHLEHMVARLEAAGAHDAATDTRELLNDLLQWQKNTTERVQRLQRLWLLIDGDETTMRRELAHYQHMRKQGIVKDWALTANEIAEELGISRSTVDSWVHRGHITPIPGSRPQRYWMSEVYAAEKARREREQATRRNFSRPNDMTNPATC